MHYYQHNIGDYRRDTSHLSLLEHGIYRQLIDLYYMEEKAIPKETQWVMRRLSAKTQVEQDAVMNVLNDFFELSDDGYSHRRCDSEIGQYQQNAEKNRTNGKLGGRPRKYKVDENQSDTGTQNPEKPSGFISDTQTEAKITLTNNHKPITNNQDKEKTNRKPPASLSVSDLVGNGVDELVAREFISTRKRKLTSLALAGIQREAAKAGWSLEDALRKAVERGWQSFEASWVAPDKSPGQSANRNQKYDPKSAWTKINQGLSNDNTIDINPSLAYQE